jgi:cell filamentation protein
MRYAGEGQDPYCYPGTDVLKNIPGIRDNETLQQFETEISQWEQARIELTPVEGAFDLSHLREIHRRLFQQVYEWAGAIRTGNISRDETLFANHSLIESYGVEVFEKLAGERKLWVRDSPPREFLGRLAEYFGEINALHPFREGNGRTQ